MRGLWVVRHSLTTKNSIDDMFGTAKKYGFTDLFVQVRGRGDAYYLSNYEPIATELIENNFDALAYLLNHELAQYFRIHAWVNVFYIWSAETLPTAQNHILNKNPHWLAHSKNNGNLLNNYPALIKNENVEGLYLSPLHPEVQKHMMKVIEDLIDKYPLNGIHLDYLRYPNVNFDLHPLVVKTFREKYLIDPLELLYHSSSVVNKYGLSGYEMFIISWRRYLMNGLTEFVEKLSNRIKSKNQSLVLSAAVKPDIIQARWEYYQDWQKWIKKDLVDYVIPMNYAKDSSLFQLRLNSYFDSIPHEKYRVGMALYNQSEEEVIQKIKQINVLNNGGFVLFSYEQLRGKLSLQQYLIREF